MTNSLPDLVLTAPETPDAAAAVFATVAYADVFDMPITRPHLRRFVVGQALDEVAIEAAIAELSETGRLVDVDGLLHLAGREEVLGIHRERTARAAQMWPAAERWGRRIGRLPFVRMVAVTGGLAVDSVAPHDDIDYFIVVRAGRLWLTRLMIIALGKIAARDDLELCPNYIVAEHEIDMSVQSVYVARELAQMIAVVDADRCRAVREQNDWLTAFLPNATMRGDESHAVISTPTRAQLALEAVLLLAPFGRLERWEMDRKIAKLTKGASRRPEVGTPDESAFSPDVCKGHVNGNAEPIDVAWRARLEGDNVRA